MLLSLYVRAHNWWWRTLSGEEGATAAEYGLLIALIAVAMILGARLLGNQITTRLSDVGTTIQGA